MTFLKYMFVLALQNVVFTQKIISTVCFFKFQIAHMCNKIFISP